MRGIGLGFIAILMGATNAAAMPPATSILPMERPSAHNALATVSISTAQPRAISPQAVRTSLRPVNRGAPSASVDPGFVEWISGFRARALAQGIDAATFDRAFADVAPVERVIRRDRNQAEFSRTIWDYLDGAVSRERVENGRTALAAHRQTLSAIEERYGVEAEVVVAIWGLESAYGALRGSTDIVAAMATLAHDGRRRDFFETQLVAALRILQAGDVPPRQMVGSWAGAMGHTQFMPTSYLDHAQDFDGDGRRDIWSDDPTDALASTAAYLAHFGWTRGQPWGMEVRLPRNFDYGLSGERIRRSADFWRAQGITKADGSTVPDHGDASILLPAGADGVAFMIFDNFRVIERYNPADAYVIGVGHLADRIAGGGSFRADWPRGDRALSGNERRELQRRLTAAGFPTDGVDGIVGPNTIEAVRRFQRSIGTVPDGYASLRLLERLR